MLEGDARCCCFVHAYTIWNQSCKIQNDKGTALVARAKGRGSSIAAADADVSLSVSRSCAVWPQAATVAGADRAVVE